MGTGMTEPDGYGSKEVMDKLHWLREPGHHHAAPCPNCGYCPVCGRGREAVPPLGPYTIPATACYTSLAANFTA
jgi:hypothetical protein